MELRVKAGQHIKIAPKEIQQTSQLLSTNWLLATVDNRTSGLIPANYIKRVGPSKTPLVIPIVPPMDQAEQLQSEKLFTELSEELGFAAPDGIRIDEAELVD